MKGSSHFNFLFFSSSCAMNYDEVDNDDEDNDNDDYMDNDDEVEDEEEAEEEEEEDPEQVFSTLCSRLQRNDRKVENICWGYSDNDRFNLGNDFFMTVRFDDAHCFRFSRALTGNTHLKSLTVKFNRSHCFTFQGSAALAKGFGNSKLKSIAIIGTNPFLPRPDGFSAFQQRLFGAIRQSQSIQELSLNSAEVNFLALSALLHDDALTWNKCPVVALKFRHCKFLNEDNLKLLAVALHGNKSVKSLNFQSNEIDDVALSGFINFWSPDSPLEELNLTNNQLCSDGVRLLLKAAAVHPSFIKLEISSNKFIGFDGIRLLGEELGNVHLKELRFIGCTRSNNVESDTVSKMLAFDALAEGLRNNTTIEKIDSSCVLSDVGPDRLRKLLRATTNRPVFLHLYLWANSTNDILAIGEELSSARLKELHLDHRVSLESDIQARHRWNVAFQVLLQGLRNNLYLQVFRLDDTLLRSTDVGMLMMALRSHPTMEKLVLCKNHSMGYLGMQRIGEQLAFTNLKSIVLNDTMERNDIHVEADEFTDETCRALAEGLRNSTTIQELQINFACFTTAQALLLVRAVTNHPSMAELQIFFRNDLDMNQLKLIADEIPSLRLTLLNIRCFYMEPMTTTTAIKAYDLARVTLQQGMKHNFHLCKLDIALLDEDKQIQFYLELNRFGRLQILEGQGLAPVLWCYLLDKLKSEPSHMYYFLREQPWVISSGQTLV
jgi:hypothetical protein